MFLSFHTLNIDETFAMKNRSSKMFPSNAFWVYCKEKKVLSYIVLKLLNSVMWLRSINKDYSITVIDFYLHWTMQDKNIIVKYIAMLVSRNGLPFYIIYCISCPNLYTVLGKKWILVENNQSVLLLVYKEILLAEKDANQRLK